jgi:diacylglycerol kinase family enzyme
MYAVSRWRVVGNAHRFRDVICVAGRTIEISSEGPVPIQPDGELKGFTPVKLELVSDALTLLVPAEFRSAGRGLA